MNNKRKSKLFLNNIYAVKTVWKISKTRVIHTAVDSVIGYVEWIFMSIFFLRYVIGAIENEAPIGTILFFIGICFVVFLLLAMYQDIHLTMNVSIPCLQAATPVFQYKA